MFVSAPDPLPAITLYYLLETVIDHQETERGALRCVFPSHYLAAQTVQILAQLCITNICSIAIRVAQQKDGKFSVDLSPLNRVKVQTLVQSVYSEYRESLMLLPAPEGVPAQHPAPDQALSMEVESADGDVPLSFQQLAEGNKMSLRETWEKGHLREYSRPVSVKRSLQEAELY